MEKIIKKGDKVSVYYTGKLENGEIFDSNIGGAVLEFKVGAGQMIAGFDNALLGMKIGEKKTIKIEAVDAYGEYDENAKQIFRKKDLVSFKAAGYTFNVGDTLPFSTGDLPIIASDDETITIDTNHFLAGKTLIFDIELVK